MTPQKKTGLALVGVAAVMLSLSFAAVPFYDWFCRVTGYAGTVSVAEQGADKVLDRTIDIRFDASLEAGMPWEFKPQVHKTASYNVMPDLAGGYFTKIECFCFTEQVLQPGERVIMPVSFYVDPSIVDDPEAGLIKEITLSYTFHETALPDQQAALAAAPAKPIN